MPGIAGIISRESPAVCRDRLTAMLDSMRHDPGYQSVVCDAPEMGVYAGCVAHPDSFAAMESGCGEAGAVDLVVAGECFPDCSSAGVTSDSGDGSRGPCGSLRSRYDRLGENWVAKLNGLFSGLLIDRRCGRAILFNDRYGMERVYVHENGHGTYFASEAKALLRVLPETRSFDDEGVAQFLRFGCVLDGGTLFRGIRTLEGGSSWTFEGGSAQKRRYFTPAEWERQPVLSADDFQSEFERRFKRALPRYLGGNARIGISLTGGLDTRMIMACLPTLARPPICYTFAGLNGLPLDARIAARVASECGLEHHLLRIGPDFLSEYGAYVDRTVFVTDGCAGALATHEIYLNAQARRLAPFRLTGNFGSEVLRSMSTFKSVGLSPELIASDFRPRVDAASSDASAAGPASVTFAAFREIPWSLFGLMASAKSQLSVRTPYLDNGVVGLAYQAPATVRTSPDSALRLVHGAHAGLGRIPTDRAVAMNGDSPLYLLRRLSAEIAFKLDYMHKESPQWGLSRVLAGLDKVGLLGLHKWLPYRLWFQKELAAYMTEALTDPRTLGMSFWNQRALPKIVNDHVNGKDNHVRDINAVITLAAVDRLLIRGQS